MKQRPLIFYNKFIKFSRDFDAAETVKEKVNKLMDVKGIKGLRKLMKEIAMTASTGKHDNELIGRTAITLKVGIKQNYVIQNNV